MSIINITAMISSYISYFLNFSNYKKQILTEKSEILYIILYTFLSLISTIFPNYFFFFESNPIYIPPCFSPSVKSQLDKPKAVDSVPS